MTDAAPQPCLYSRGLPSTDVTVKQEEKIATLQYQFSSFFFVPLWIASHWVYD